MGLAKKRHLSILPPEELPGTKAYTVLRAARKIFFMHGFSAATTDMIQREAGVSKSTVYAYYANKEALFVAVVQAECWAFQETIRAIKFSPGKLRETLSALAHTYLDIVLSEPGSYLYRIIVAEGIRFPALASTFYMAGPHVIAAMVAEHLASAVTSGEVDLGDVELDEAANVFVNLVRSEPQLLYLTHPDAAPSSQQIDRWVKVVIDTFMRAYGCSCYRIS
ncbi:TetR/AcrR family transcriptional regulator [Ferribacterium limneticum]|uniref:TetR/AcrR family transcriptional regulator n=1 Tax=Ferribacterium limneticum TaxID=76259 RepID=UPI001CFB1421|nr:TetR/AcrR family transcriptional regulator [Ferribacterium limneticum]UCV17807.1 TetR/AcrR family transcriptional regulator [Ferribacterium limneticum]